MSSLSSTSGAVRGGGGGSSRSAFQEQVQNEAPTGGDAATFAANAKAQQEDYASGTYTDPDLSVENDAVKDLAPRSSARWVAVADGNWSSTSTWYDTTDGDQTVPDVADATVLIPQGVTVTYDVAKASALAMKWVRVDGTLIFDTTADRDWLHEYTYIDHTGTFTCGTEASPVPSTTTIQFNIDCDSDIDFANDRMKLGRGFVCFDGTVSIIGASKVAHTRVPSDPALAPSATDTTITLDRQVVGGSVGDWEVGDTILITGTRLKGWHTPSNYQWETSETEERTISSIDNSTPSAPVITLNAALTYDHPPSLYGYELDYDGEVTGFTEGATFNGGSATIIGVDDNGDGTGTLIFEGDPGAISDNDPITDSAGGSATANGTVTNTATCHVVNMTRNVKFEPTLTDTTQFWRRPHNLWKGRGTVDIHYVETNYYGRTDHNQNEFHTGSTYAFGDYIRGKNGYNAWNGPDIMTAQMVDWDGKVTGFDVADVEKQGQPYGETVSSTSGGSAKIGDVQDNGDGTGTLILVDISGTFADNDTITSNRGAEVTQNGATYDVATTAKTVFTGRYPMHMHRCGPESPATPTVTFKGNVVRDAPAWGYVHHDSHADIDQCVSYFSRSAGFASEGGGNIGLWSNNLATDQYEPWGVYNISAAKVGGTEFGGFGHGYWLQSRSLRLDSNIACNFQCGILWTTRVGSAQNTGVYPGSVSDSRIFYGLAESPDTTVVATLAVIERFDDCESYACYWGGAVAKNMPNQGHDKRTLLQRFKTWECYYGFVSQYTAHYTIKDFEAHGLSVNERTGGPWAGKIGISNWRQNTDMAVVNPDIRGINYGIQYIGQDTNITNERKNMVVVEPKFRSVDTHYTDNWTEITINPTWSYLGTYTDVYYYDNADVGTIGASFAWDEDEMVWNGSRTWAFFGSVTDSLGTKATRSSGTSTASSIVGDYAVTQSEVDDAQKITLAYGTLTLLENKQFEAMIKAQGTYDSTAGDKVLLIPDLISDRFDGSVHTFFTPVAIRVSETYFNTLGPNGGVPTNNGPLDDGVGGAYEGFDPVGTNGLT